MAPQVRRELPPFMQIANHFRQRIVDGELAPGAKLPSIAEIAGEWGVATATAAKGVKQLQADGYVRSSTQGTFVDLGRRQTTGPDRLRMVRVGGSAIRPGERVEILSAGLEAAPADVAEALGVDAGARVIRRRRRYTDDEGVMAVSTSWLPAELAQQAPELLAPEPLPAMTFGLVEERTGRRAVRRRDTVALAEAAGELAELLGVAVGTSVLTWANHYWDQNGSVTEYATDFLGPDRRLSAEYDMP
ncbi:MULTISPECIES: GntR family transcriptional regulator [Streptomyces]|uniref:UTRA domain-containing protein n=1 Tax=Streptomyces tsukubensis (strain DSM 42081 / NBRC 108919 / NRRL 18488 / 9993) TaxID=1114943 RepID=A0A7G3UEN0_STRT9|nr:MULTISPECIES: UTRA domain-containing protein [Streptomyces]AZK96149.1 GntR family transcriptional regulator [Streptomyces tsukubensis]MYS68600.1 UTRA domain-containing protein [Streptomyces sp. SID5473]QKM67835.1 UTRA domain-containing protein [Streptomyces tsukubensis NRRL18488]TAI44230.1 UTRA domain-containing protein [Streptomyces tsukubensis]